MLLNGSQSQAYAKLDAAIGRGIDSNEEAMQLQMELAHGQDTISRQQSKRLQQQSLKGNQTPLDTCVDFVLEYVDKSRNLEGTTCLIR